MLDFLERLIKERKWEEALVISEQLLLDQNNTLDDQLCINVALITARAWVGEYAGVVLLGDHAARMAADLHDWEAYLTIHHYLGYAFAALDQWSEAKKVWFRFIEYLPLNGKDHEFEVMTWFHLGISSEKEQDLDSAVRFYLQARTVAERNDNGRQVLGVNHALIQAFTKQGRFELVPALLAKAAHYLRHNQDAPDWNKANLFHMQVRASFALATGRFKRAKLIAGRAISDSSVAPENRFPIHMILAKAAKQIGTPAEMVEHYLQARVSAIRARRYDFEVDAAETLYQYIQSHPGALEMTLNELASYDLPDASFEMEGVPSRKLRP